MTVVEYLAYFDSTREALFSVSPELKFGGPGGSCRGSNGKGLKRRALGRVTKHSFGQDMVTTVGEKD